MNHCFLAFFFFNNGFHGFYGFLFSRSSLTHPPPLGREGVGLSVGSYMQLCTPRLVAIAVSIAAIVCNTNFQVSVFIAFKIIRLKIFSLSSSFSTTDCTDFTDFFSRSFLTYPPPLGRSALATLGSSKNGRGGF